MKYFVNVLVDVLEQSIRQQAHRCLSRFCHVCLYAGKEAGCWTGSQSVDLAVLKKAAGFADTFSLCFIPVCCFFVRYSVGASGEIRWKT